MRRVEFENLPLEQPEDNDVARARVATNRELKRELSFEVYRPDPERVKKAFVEFRLAMRLDAEGRDPYIRTPQPHKKTPKKSGQFVNIRRILF